MADRKVQKVLVANRGEIAVRVIRTCRDMGIIPVSVFSDVDKTAVHVQMADEAYCLGPGPSAQSYLRGDAILEVAARCGADAVHPGYGFLSENAGFADACEKAGIIFIGPTSAAIKLMGDKTAAKTLMGSAGVPMTPGTEQALSDEGEARRIAADIGYPVLLKAAAGGGGKGMRIVEHPDDIGRALTAAQNEARSAFGDERVFLEKYIVAPRHVEFQVLADEHGNAVHLFERECSVQRRHQKVIEEAPCSIVTPELRRQMGEAAVAATLACGYRSAGTIEFLVDTDRNYYFMEMNTRLQVEHPVTEWVTGIDLVAEQIRIAEGRAIGFRQEDLRMHGHAIECRIYAEDPQNDFLPDIGRLSRYRIPAGPGVRVDDGVDEGYEIPVHYDPMIAKLTTWGSDRDQAIQRMKRALGEYQIGGVATTIQFCQFVMGSEPFQRGMYDTHFVENHYRAEATGAIGADSTLPAAIAASVSLGERADGKKAAADSGPVSNWKARRRRSRS